jgi:predicted CoA-substrate-specific enzyme activase
MKHLGMDVGSTTVKAVLVENGETLWKDYQRHATRQAEKSLEFLNHLEVEHDLCPGQDRIYVTGSGAGMLAPLLGAKFVQEVVAVAQAVERLHPSVRFVSEIGGEDMKTVFFTPTSNGTAKQVYMQSACSGGTGTFIEKTARKLHIEPADLSAMAYRDLSLHKVSSKCGIFAEADANTLVKSGVPVEEIIASLFEAVVHQNLATLTKGNTPAPEALLLGGPNLFFSGLQQAWRHHLERVWSERGIELPDGKCIEELILVPDDALYYACLGCIEVGRGDAGEAAVYQGTGALRHWVDEEQHAQKASDGDSALISGPDELAAFIARYAPASETPESALRTETAEPSRHPGSVTVPVYLGCDFGSTTAKAVVIDSDGELLFQSYVMSEGNPIEDAKACLREVREAGFEDLAGVAITGYGKDLLKDIVGADVAVVETVAHAAAALHFFPDADAICDVGGCDVKIMLLRQGTVADFRLNSQCSSGNGAFLQGVAERYDLALESYAERAFEARAIPTLAMGCGVFLQSDIVNQQRKGWAAEEIMAGLAAVLPLNVWIYAGQLQNLGHAGRKFILQGGTHRNLAVVKAQVDFIEGRVPDAEVVVHPYPGEAGAIGAALCARDRDHALPSRFRGYEQIEALRYRSTTNQDTTCNWCSVNCRRTFIDVELPEGEGRTWSKVPLESGWERVISGNSCPKGLLEDAREMRLVKAQMEDVKRDNPNLAEMVREQGFRPQRVARVAQGGHS